VAPIVFFAQDCKKNPGHHYYQQPGKGKGMESNRCFEKAFARAGNRPATRQLLVETGY